MITRRRRRRSILRTKQETETKRTKLSLKCVFLHQIESEIENTTLDNDGNY